MKTKLIRALNDNIDYTRRHAMHRKQKSDDPQPDDDVDDSREYELTASDGIQSK